MHFRKHETALESMGNTFCGITFGPFLAGD